MKCFFCGAKNKSVKKVADPHAERVYDQTIILQLCDKCYEKRKK